MADKPFYTEVVKSKGSAVYVKGIRVFEHKDGTIHVASSDGHTYCPKGSSIEKFFRRILEGAR